MSSTQPFIASTSASRETKDDGRVPRSVRFATEAPDRLSRIPHFPEPDRPQPGLLAALCDAAQTTNKDGPRVALSRIQLSGGEGQIVATDSRQLLLQRGFRLSWSEEVLMPVVKLFSRRSLCDGREVGIGKTKDHVFLQSDRWDLALMIDATNSFPNVRCVLPREGSEQARLLLHADDAKFLAGALPKCTSTNGDPSLVTLDLESPPVARMRASSDSDITEIELSRSRSQGHPLQVALDSRYLQRILNLGFGEIRFTGDDRAVWCEDKNRTYLCMPHGNAAIKPAPGACPIGFCFWHDGERASMGSVLEAFETVQAAADERLGALDDDGLGTDDFLSFWDGANREPAVAALLPEVRREIEMRSKRAVDTMQR